VNPRSGRFPRHRALMPLSCATSVAEARDSGIIRNVCVRPTRRTAPRRLLRAAPASVNRWQSMIASSPR
jgi:hypothetical protein